MDTGNNGDQKAIEARLKAAFKVWSTMMGVNEPLDYYRKPRVKRKTLLVLAAALTVAAAIAVYRWQSEADSVTISVIPNVQLLGSKPIESEADGPINVYEIDQETGKWTWIKTVTTAPTTQPN